MSVHGAKNEAAQTTTTTPRAPSPVTIEIRGKRLSIRTDHDPEHVLQLARYVDSKVRSLQTAAPNAPFEKLLMLASLNIAEELFESQEAVVRMRRGVTERTEAMLALLDSQEGR